MAKIAIVTDSNSGITQEEGKKNNIFVLPMPFYINGSVHLEDINLSQKQFYEKLEEDAEISTSQPSVGDVLDFWDDILKEYDQIIYIPMSSGLSGACETAMMLANDYEGKVFVVDNQRISVTQKLSVYEAKYMAENGMTAEEIRDILMEYKKESSIYITLETLKYLKKGGRITPAAAAFGAILKIKPVLQIQGEKLDAFAKVRSLKIAKNTMIEAIEKDSRERFGADDTLDNIVLMLAYTGEAGEILNYKENLEELYPGHKMMMDPLSLSVSCHIGPGAIGIACCKKLPMVDYDVVNNFL